MKQEPALMKGCKLPGGESVHFSFLWGYHGSGGCQTVRSHVRDGHRGVCRGPSPALKIQPQACAGLDQCVQGERECFCLWELFPIQNYFLVLIPGTGSSNGSPKHWHDLEGILSLSVVSCHCQATPWFQTALAPLPLVHPQQDSSQ